MEISVVIPCYNASNYLGRCLDALKAQTYKDFEVICVDDCSTDETAQLIEDYSRYTSLQLKYVRNEINSGPAASRNKGIQIACGNYVAFCDSDDWYAPDYLAKMIQAAESRNADLVLCGHKLIVEKSKRIMERPLKVTEDELRDKRLLLCLPVDALWALMIRRKMFDDIEIPNIRTNEDMAVIPVLIAKAKSVACVYDCIYNYLVRPGSLSMSPVRSNSGDSLFSYKYIRDVISKEYSAEVEFIGVRNLVYGALLSIFTYGNDKKTAEYILNEFEKDFPEWLNNRHLKLLPLYKRVYVYFAHKRFYFALKALSRLHFYLVSN